LHGPLRTKRLHSHLFGTAPSSRSDRQRRLRYGLSRVAILVEGELRTRVRIAGHRKLSLKGLLGSAERWVPDRCRHPEIELLSVRERFNLG
jgi:hypothetical protein